MDPVFEGVKGNGRPAKPLNKIEEVPAINRIEKIFM